MLTHLKNISYLYVGILVFLVLIGNSSCGESALPGNVEITPIENERLDQSIQLRSLDEGMILERRMQWASYISARIFCQYPEAREEVAELLDRQNTDAIEIDQLIVSTQNTPIFQEVFIDQVGVLLHHIDENPKPTHNHPIPPSSRQGTLLAASDYIDALTVKNCIELYFPNGLNSTEEDFYYSTAHPMTLVQSNYGYKLSCAKMDTLTGEWGSAEIVVDDLLLQDNNTVIVTRPYRTEGSLDCLYSKYDHIDFTQFLNPQ